MNTESCAMVRHADDDAVHAGPPGSFCIETDSNGQRMMIFKYPDGDVGGIFLRPMLPSNPPHPSWEWDGNGDAPTLTPSVHRPGRWHGWFRAGRMESC